jgi:hypothetical protein
LLPGSDEFKIKRGSAMPTSTTPCEPRNGKIHRSVTIQAVFASDIQRDVAMRVLAELLEAWKANVESSHKRNIITITHGKAQGITS